jgi:ATP-dependent DNA helicase RecQ
VPEPSPAPHELLHALRATWGYPAFRAGQDEAVQAVAAGRDTLAVLPTGGGKSLLFQVPAVASRALTVVVSPLLALMRDQVDALARLGVPAAMLHGGLSLRETDQIWTNAEFGMYRLLYLTPERLESELFLARAPRIAVGWLAVDEAHCISEWGHDFRPAYRRIAVAREVLRTGAGASTPLVAVTATATPEVRRDIVEQLALRDPVVLVRGFDRPNIEWRVRYTENKEREVAAELRELPGPGLVYCGTRRATEQWAASLSARGVGSEAYHAGLPAARREAVQRRWLDGETRIIAATSAFGMGIDKPDVRSVLHVALPPTLESYYQEAGRAGRDGLPSVATLMVGPGDDALPRALAEQSHPLGPQVQAVYAAAGSLAQIAVGSLPKGPVDLDLTRLATVARVSESVALASLERLEKADLVRVHAAHESRDVVHLRVPGGIGAFRALAAESSRALRAFVDALLRALDPQAFSDWTPVRLATLSRQTGLPEERVGAGLAYLQARGVLDLSEPTSGLRLDWLQPRRARAPLDEKALAAGRRRALERTRAMMDYVEDTGCRRRHLLTYFGERASARCGSCDVCLAAQDTPIVPSDEEALRATLRRIAEPEEGPWTLGKTSTSAAKHLDWLIQRGLVEMTDPLTGALAVTDAGRRYLV